MIESLSRMTRLDMRYILQSGFWLYAGHAVTLLVALGTAIAFANLISPEIYGNYKYILSVTSILGVLTLSGLASALPRAAARGYDGSLHEAFVLTLKWSVGMFLIAGAVGSYYLFQGNTTLGVSFLIAGSATPLITAASLFRPYLIGKKEFRLVGALTVLQTAVPPVATVLMVLVTHSVVALIATYFVSTTLTAYIAYRVVSARATGSVDPELTHIGKNISIMNVITAAVGQLDNILIFQLLGGAELALYTFATAIPEQARGSLKHIASIALPKFAVKEKAAMKAATQKNSLTLLGMTVVITIVYILLAPFIFSTLFPVYMSAVPYSQVFALTIMTSMVLASTYLDAQAAIREKYILNFVANTARDYSSRDRVVWTVGRDTRARYCALHHSWLNCVRHTQSLAHLYLLLGISIIIPAAKSEGAIRFRTGTP